MRRLRLTKYGQNGHKLLIPLQVESEMLDLRGDPARIPANKSEYQALKARLSAELDTEGLPIKGGAKQSFSGGQYDVDQAKRVDIIEGGVNNLSLGDRGVMVQVRRSALARGVEKPILLVRMESPNGR